MKTINFHKTNYGWNYGYQKKGGKIRLYRYFTNGSNNGDNIYSKWMSGIQPPKNSDEVEVLLFHHIR